MRETSPISPKLFLGRDVELREYVELLHEADCHLLNLVGPGGIGKTTLAIRIAAELAPNLPNGMAFIDLAPVQDVDGMIAAVAKGVNFQFYEREDWQQQLLYYFAHKTMLLVWDNFEHLVPDGTGLLLDLLEAAPNLKMLVTSREVLNIAGEWVRDVSGLAYPANIAISSEHYPALQLFAEHARRVSREFSLDDELPYVIDICQQVAGMPLGIELAAAWCKRASCRDIAEELRHNLDILTSKGYLKNDRHRSIRAVFERSWEMLTDAERIAFMKLSIFRAGFTAHAAEQVAGASRFMLSDLVDKSLLAVTSEGRYMVHELLRQFAREQLHLAGLAETVIMEHGRYFARFMQEREALLKSNRDREAIQAIRADLDNILAAWSHAIQEAHYELIDVMIDGLWLYFSFKGLMQQSLGVFDEGLQNLDPDINPRVYYRVLTRYAVQIIDMGMKPTAHDHLEKCMVVAREIGDLQELGFTLRYFGYMIIAVKHDFDGGMALVDEAIEIYHELGDQWELAATIQIKGMLYTYKSQNEREVLKWMQQSYEMFAAIGNHRRMLANSNNIAISYRMLGDPKRALVMFEEGLVNARQENYLGMIWMSLTEIASVSVLLGDYARAITCYDEAIAVAHDMGTPPRAYMTMYLRADALITTGKAEDALAYLEDMQLTIPPKEERYMHFHLERTRAVIAYKEGRYQDAILHVQSALKDTAPYFKGYAASECIQCLSEIRLGDYEVARHHIRECLNHYEEVPDALWAIGIWAELLRAEGQSIERVIELMAMVSHDTVSSANVRQMYSELLETLQTEVPPEVFAAAVERGRLLDFDEVIASILPPQSTTLETPPAIDPYRERLMQVLNSVANQTLPDPLTEREVEIVLLLESGITNREIAAQFVIAEGTVRIHMNRILRKLDAKNRTQAAAHARELGLL